MKIFGKVNGKHVTTRKAVKEVFESYSNEDFWVSGAGITTKLKKEYIGGDVKWYCRLPYLTVIYVCNGRCNGFLFPRYKNFWLDITTPGA